LLEIACQECFQRFLVEMNVSVMDSVRAGREVSLADQVRRKVIHYGDPPRHGGEACAAGDTMNCIDLRVVEFWRLDRFDWFRVVELEIELENIKDWDERPF